MKTNLVALITGSTSGIGLGIAKVLASRGCHLMLHGLASPEEIGHLKEIFERDYQVNVRFSSLDLRTPGAAGQLVLETERELGKLDILINNAGIQHVAPLESFTREKWDAVMAINLSSAFDAIGAALSGMKARGYGRIINIASAHGLVASVNKAAYVSAKHGLIGLTKVTALETAGTGVTCNAICPGWVKTPLVEKQIEARAKTGGIPIAQAERDLLLEKQPSGQFTTPEQIGEFVAFLCSEAAANITGSSLPMDGAWTAV